MCTLRIDDRLRSCYTLLLLPLFMVIVLLFLPLLLLVLLLLLPLLLLILLLLLRSKLFLLVFLLRTAAGYQAATNEELETTQTHFEVYQRRAGRITEKWKVN